MAQTIVPAYCYPTVLTYLAEATLIAGPRTLALTLALALALT